MANTIPHLSRDGWMSNPIEIISKLFEYYIISEYSQSNTFRGHIASLKYDLTMGKSMEEKKDNIIISLKTMYERYYGPDNITVTVTMSDNDSKVNFNIDIEIINNNTTYTLNNNIKTTNNVISDIETSIASINVK